MRFPFDDRSHTIVPPSPSRKSAKAAKAPVEPPRVVRLAGHQATLGESTYRLTPAPDGAFLCSRPGSTVPVGLLTKHGVRKALTGDFFKELSILQAAVYGRPTPLPLCYEMHDRTFVHTGPCFEAHPESRIHKTRYHMTEDSDARCVICKETFL